MLNRRMFLKATAFLAVASNLFLTACNAIYTQILNWVGVGLGSLSSVVSILEAGGVVIPGGGVIDLAVKAAQLAFKAIQDAVAKYNAAPASQKTSLLTDIATAIQSAEGSVQNFWNTLALPSGQLATLIEGLLGIITTTLAGFAASLPPVQAVSVSGGRKLAVLAVKRDKKKFAKDFNVLLAGTPYAKFAIKV